MTTEMVEIGSLPPVGEVPEQMWASVIRQDRFGDPAGAFVIEAIPVPQPGPGEVLVAVMAAGVNYNNVWAARGVPVDVIASRQRGGDPHDFHIGGSDASGIVYALGDGVEGVEIGAEVVVHPGWWDPTDPWIAAGKDPMIAPSAKIWGYDTNFGSFAQFCIVQAHQLLPKASRLSWAEAAAPTLVGTTAYRMLFGWEGNTMKADDVVLVWGGSGGLGSQAIQLAVATGARAVAVVSDDVRGEYCTKLGASGYVLRGQFDHWGIPPHWDDAAGQKVWSAGARAFGKAFWDALGERRNPDLVFEHPGEATVPTSIFVCEAGGMVVICAGTTGYSATVDLRYHWTRQKRFQGSHGTNDEQARAYNELVRAGRIDPCLGRLYTFDEIGRAHAEMAEGVDVLGNRVILVGATDAEQGRGEVQA
ncbi:MAG: putative crotonyl-CoA reductase [Actinomycetia bacterium]|nr:putative crotonyl-CoA reductase [Actinomycetes bacterium]